MATSGARRAFTGLRTALAGCLIALVTPGAVDGQAGEHGGGALSGQVLETDTREPLADVMVVMELVPVGVLSPGRSGGLQIRDLGAVTDSAGWYQLAWIPAGVYRLRVSRIGYKPASLEIDLASPRLLRLNVALRLDPIELEPLDVKVGRAHAGFAGALTERGPRAEGTGPYLTSDDRVDLELFAPDATRLVRRDFERSSTMGEADIFRALSRLPGVSTRGDFSSELWTRGLSWGLTRVEFDGLPLFNPMHVGGAASGVGAEAVESATLYPGIRPAALMGGTAGFVALRSRTAGEGRSLDVEMTPLSLHGRIATRLLDGKLGVAAVGRRSWWDWLIRLEGDSPGEPARPPEFVFGDVTGRLDYQVSSGSRIDVSYLWEVDQLNGDVPRRVVGSRGDWGNRVGSVSLTTSLFGLPSQILAGHTTYRATISNEPRSAILGRRSDAITLAEADTRIGYSRLRLETGSAGGRAASGWSAGSELVRQDLRQREGLGILNGVDESSADALDQAAFWVDYRAVAGRWTLGAGGRVEVGESVAHSGSARWSPRLSARVDAGPQVKLSMAYGRTYQYAQAVTSAGRPVGPQLHYAQVWATAGERVPAAKTDLASLGIEYWRVSGATIRATAWLRRIDGLIVPNPNGGEVQQRILVYEPDTWVAAENRAIGLDVAVRSPAGRRVGGSIAYSALLSAMTAGDLRFASPAERRHTLNALGEVHVSDGLIVGSGVTVAAGWPFSRVFNQICDDDDGPCLLDPDAPDFRGEPFEARAPGYGSLDLFLDWAHDGPGVRWGLRAQLRNILGIDNQAAYGDTLCLDTTISISQCPGSERVSDRFFPGLTGLVPSISFRAHF